MSAASSRGVSQIGERGRPGGVGSEEIAPVGGGLFEDGFGVAGEEEEFGAIWRRWSRVMSRFICAFEDDVRIRTGDAEAGDASDEFCIGSGVPR